MQNNREILDEFGKRIISECFDGCIKQLISLRNLENPPFIFKEKSGFLKSLNQEQFNDLKKIVRGNFEVSFHEFFKIFEENRNYKITFEEDGKTIDLSEISEMLKAEHIIENGWIERFSEFNDDTK